MSIEATVESCRDLLDLWPGEAVERAREKHPDVRGFAVFPVYAPLEIIHAAGLLPVGMFGAGSKVESNLADSRFQSFICSIAKSTLELFLRGDMDGFEGAVFSSICDVARNLASVVERNCPRLYVEYLHLPQNMNSAGSLDYTCGEFARFRDNLAKRLVRPIEDDAIARSITLYNRLRSLTRAVYDLRRTRPGCLSAAEVCTVMQAGTRMMPEQFIGVLESFLAAAERRTPTPRDSVRVVIEGAFCEQPPIELIDAIEAAGCEVRDDDMMIGWRMIGADVAADGDPVEALACAYLDVSVYTSVRHDARAPRTQGLLDRMKRAGAEAVIFAPAKFCEPALLDYVPFRRTLDEHGVPHLKIEFEEKMWTFDRPRSEVETFAESMLFE